ncbi:DUF58 domain-containing protein [Dokdonia sp. Hel_I_53]|uniref:DUF58 domain-containing protein n=1 Tax=Dokdonia sp. Hel_I_53 TaxID=1566287 RepID=UPI00119A6A3B|nr:DUF58 domain-containing protein [Dokdonia sp. Hel_I_53]TVZ53347.1 uncharacterized protein DUF58 [Dokdonia sp. Hel_I_53]
MPTDYKELLKPEVINSVSGLSLIARVVVEGYLSGLNRSRRVGAGLEFSQYRGYEPGDDLRLLDWKMLARSGRYYIKQSELDTHINVKFIIDNSNSMLHQEDELSKAAYANVLVACLAHLAHSQGDAVGLHIINNKKIETIQPAIGKQHFNRFLYQLIEREVSGTWPQNLTSEKLHHRNDKELLFFITDFYENSEEITKTIQQLKTTRNEVIVIHLMGNSELAFNYEGQIIFEDLENRNKIKVNTKDGKKEYLKHLTAHMSAIKELLLRKNIGYELITLESDVAEALQLFLKKRRNLV